jgi:TolB protein
MKRTYLLFVQSILLIGFLFLASCGGSSTGPGDETNNNAPAAPANLNGTSGDQEIVLSWDSNSESDLAGYNLYRSTDTFSGISEMDPVNGAELIPSADFTDTGLDNGTTYYYRLTAVDNKNNESSISSQLEITPFSNPPDHP